MPNFGFGETRFLQRSAHEEFRCGLGAGTIIARVAGILAVSDYAKSFSFGERGQFCEKFVFAEITAVVWVGEILGIFKFTGIDYADGKIKLPSDSQRLF